MPDTPIYGIPYQGSTHDPDGASLGRRLALGVEQELSRVDDDIATAQADIGDLETDITTYLLNRPVFRSSKISNKSIASGAEDGPGTMTFDINKGGFSSSIHSSIVEVPITGYYEVNLVARWDGSLTNCAFQITARRNSTSATDPTTGDIIATGLASSGSDGRDRTVIATTVRYFAAGENVQMGLIQNSGSSVDVIGGNSYSSYYELVLKRP